MREFFRGWKRKVGVVTLVMALTVTAAWVRSTGIQDGFAIPTGGHSREVFISYDQAIVWLSFDDESSVADFGWESGTAAEIEINFTRDFDEWCWRWCGFGAGTAPAEVTGGSALSLLILPYWSIILPLCILSAYLLFSKPRNPVAVLSDKVA